MHQRFYEIFQPFADLTFYPIVVYMISLRSKDFRRPATCLDGFQVSIIGVLDGMSLKCYMSPLNLSSFYICHNAMGEVISVGALLIICDFLIRFEVQSFNLR